MLLAIFMRGIKISKSINFFLTFDLLVCLLMHQFDNSVYVDIGFYAQKQLLLSARLSHRNSVRLSVCHTGGSVKSSAS